MAGVPPKTAMYRGHRALPAGLRLRPMAAADLPQVMALEHRSQAAPWPPRLLRSLLRRRAVCRVVERRGRILAFAIMCYPGGVAHVMNLCVDPDFRGQGLGRRLLGSLLVGARRHGAPLAWLEVRISNHTALRLYRAMGFRPARLRRRHYFGPRGREHGLVMCRRLNRLPAPPPP